MNNAKIFISLPQLILLFNRTNQYTILNTHKKLYKE